MSCSNSWSMISCDHHSLADISQDWVDASTPRVVSNSLPMWSTFRLVFSSPAATICKLNWLQRYRQLRLNYPIHSPFERCIFPNVKAWPRLPLIDLPWYSYPNQSYPNQKHEQVQLLFKKKHILVQHRLKKNRMLGNETLLIDVWSVESGTPLNHIQWIYVLWDLGSLTGGGNWIFVTCTCISLCTSDSLISTITVKQ